MRGNSNANLANSDRYMLINQCNLDSNDLNNQELIVDENPLTSDTRTNNQQMNIEENNTVDQEKIKN